MLRTALPAARCGRRTPATTPDVQLQAPNRGLSRVQSAPLHLPPCAGEMRWRLPPTLHHWQSLAGLADAARRDVRVTELLGHRRNFGGDESAVRGAERGSGASDASRRDLAGDESAIRGAELRAGADDLR